MTVNNQILNFEQVGPQTNPLDQQPHASHEIPSTVTVITSPSSSGTLGKIIACVVGIILGAGMISLIGGFGTAGLLHNTGLAQYPQWLVNQINTIPNVYHNVMIYVGYIGGVIAIAISSIALYKILNPEAVEQSIGAGNALVSKNDVGTNVNTDPAMKNIRPMTEEEALFCVGMGRRSNDFSEFDNHENEDMRKLHAQWAGMLVNNHTYIFQVFVEGIVVIGKHENGDLWFTKNAFKKEGEDIKTLIRILEECKGYTRSENQCPLEEIVMVNDDSASESSSSETLVKPNQVANSNKLKRKNSHAADSSLPEVEDPNQAVVEDPKLAVVVPKIEVPAQQEINSQVLNPKEQAFMKSVKYTRTYEILEFEGDDEILPKYWENQLKTPLTYIIEAYLRDKDTLYDVIGRDKDGKMWNTEKELSNKDELATYISILEKIDGYTPSVN